jgi:type IV fimbrial biogenesis protein FimT
MAIRGIGATGERMKPGTVESGSGIPFTRGKIRGVTTIELMIALTVVAIVVALALPSFNRATRNSLLLNTANDWAASMSLARQRAVEARRDVRICPTSNNTSCDNSKNYSDGWIMFVDQNNNGSPATSELIRIGDPLDSRVSMGTPSAFDDWIEFKPGGNVNGSGATAGNFTFCSGTYHEYSRQVGVSATGRVTAKKVANLCAGD